MKTNGVKATAVMSFPPGGTFFSPFLKDVTCSDNNGESSKLFWIKSRCQAASGHVRASSFPEGQRATVLSPTEEHLLLQDSLFMVPCSSRRVGVPGRL